MRVSPAAIHKALSETRRLCTHASLPLAISALLSGAAGCGQPEKTITPTATGHPSVQAEGTHLKTKDDEYTINEGTINRIIQAPPTPPPIVAQPAQPAAPEPVVDEAPAQPLAEPPPPCLGTPEEGKSECSGPETVVVAEPRS